MVGFAAAIEAGSSKHAAALARMPFDEEARLVWVRVRARARARVRARDRARVRLRLRLRLKVRVANPNLS